MQRVAAELGDIGDLFSEAISSEPEPAPEEGDGMSDAEEGDGDASPTRTWSMNGDGLGDDSLEGVNCNNSDPFTRDPTKSA